MCGDDHREADHFEEPCRPVATSVHSAPSLFGRAWVRADALLDHDVPRVPGVTSVDDVHFHHSVEGLGLLRAVSTPVDPFACAAVALRVGARGVAVTTCMGVGPPAPASSMRRRSAVRVRLHLLRLVLVRLGLLLHHGGLERHHHLLQVLDLGGEALDGGVEGLDGLIFPPGLLLQHPDFLVPPCLSALARRRSLWLSRVANGAGPEQHRAAAIRAHRACRSCASPGGIGALRKGPVTQRGSLRHRAIRLLLLVLLLELLLLLLCIVGLRPMRIAIVTSGSVMPTKFRISASTFMYIIERVVHRIVVLGVRP